MRGGTLLVANRGEAAIRVLRSALEMGLATCAVYSPDDADCLHVRRADQAIELPGHGAAAYLDGERIVAAARRAGATAVHPGWGFLSEDAAFARHCGEAGLTFVGPSPRVLALFGDKTAARAFAAGLGIPVAAGTAGATGLDDARAFAASLGPGARVLVKAVAGGGGRGMRVVSDPGDLPAAFERCASEARAAFGDGSLYVEELVVPARHVEVQIVGDGSGAVSHLGERDCSVQRRFQKVVEIAPAPGLPGPVRDELTAAAVRLASAARFGGVGTVEFLVTPAGRIVFLEVNARLQVEHTVTEEVTGVDLVATQLRLAGGATLDELRLGQRNVPPPRGLAVQVRVNTETIAADGSVRPGEGALSAFEPPSGPGVRTDTHGYPGYRPNPRFDSLLAKVVAHVPTPDLDAAARRADRALAEFRVDGPPVNLGFLRNVLRHPDFRAGRATTDFVAEHLAELADARDDDGVPHARHVPAPDRAPTGDATAVAGNGAAADSGAAADVVDLLDASGDGTSTVVLSPQPGTVVSVLVAESATVRAGLPVVVLESMKMEHVVAAATGGVVRRIAVAVGDTVIAGAPLLVVESADVGEGDDGEAADLDLDAIRDDLADVLRRQRLTRDEGRPEVTARRHARGRRTARENLADLVDPGSFVEYGSLAIAAQRSRRGMADLIANTPADGFVGGTARVNGALFGDDAARCAVMSYDYTVLAGTQGHQGHRKKDRLFALAERLRLPVVLFAEGGGGRPGDVDTSGVSGLDCEAFALFAQLSGLVPMVGIVSGRCFAGNAALLGCCDVIIATEDASIGMAGPAMIEGGGLGRFRPEDVGPVSVQVPNGVVDLLAPADADAVDAARRYLGYFQGRTDNWECADQRLLRTLVPENRRRTYDVRRVVATLADTGSVMELRRGFGGGMITALVRVEGRPLGVVANNPSHLGGAIDTDGADKAARFLQLCDAHDLPVLYLCDTPGFMVGPDAERTAQVRHFSRMFVVGASMTVPFFTVVLRKGYGLGAQAMAGGGFHQPVFVVAWPTGEFGGMGLEGAVQLGFRKELDDIADPLARQRRFEELVARAYEHGKALNTASHFEIDDVIDPLETRTRIVEALRAAPPPVPRTGKKRPCVDTW